MKKIIAAAALSAIILTSCGNSSLGPGGYTYNKVHIDTEHYSGCFTVEKWYDSETAGIEVLTKECGSMFLSEGTYILMEGDKECPFCEVFDFGNLTWKDLIS